MLCIVRCFMCFFFKQKTAYEMRISDWSSDVCSSDLIMEAQMKQRGFDPEGTRLPIKLDTTSNGEFMPVPLDGANRRANRLAQQWASENARRRGLGRRAFMVSA